MQLDYAILASTAEPASQDRVHILGANLSSLESSSFPAEAAFVCVAKVSFQRAEFHQKHEYWVELCGPEGETWQRLVQSQAFTTPARMNRPELGSSTTIVARVNARLSDPGDYLVRLMVDGAELTRLPLYAVQKAIPALPSLDELDAIATDPSQEWLNDGSWADYDR